MNIDWLGRLADVSLSVQNFVEGIRQPDIGDLSIAKHGPRDGRVLYRFGDSEGSDVDAAVRSARRAYADGRWSKLPVQRRKDALHRLASLLESHLEELALLEALDVGKPVSEALRFDVPAAAAAIRFNAEAADKVYGRVYGADASSLSYQLRRPVGVVGGIVGWNFPLYLAVWKMGPALATGNTLVLKPSELTSLSALRVAELAIEAGVPEGVLNVVHGGAATGAAIANHPDINLVTFTGSTQTGRKLLIAAGQSNMKRVLLECGGKSPNIVFEDSPDLEAVADAVVGRAFWNQGQVCTASSRLLVHAGIKDELMRHVIRKAAALRPGDPLSASTTFGAVVSQGHRDKILSYIHSGEQEGARTAYRGATQDPCEGGFYVSPVIFDDVSPAMKIAREEIFGPVLSVMTFRDEEEAVGLANDTVYGLSTIVWTRDMARVHRVTQSIDAGWIVANTTARPSGGLGIGVLCIAGHKESGIGGEGGSESLEEYTTKTAVQLFV